MCISLTRNNKFNEGLSSVFMTVTTLCHNPVTVNNDLQQSYFRDFWWFNRSCFGVFRQSTHSNCVLLVSHTEKYLCKRTWFSFIYNKDISQFHIWSSATIWNECQGEEAFTVSTQISEDLQHMQVYLKRPWLYYWPGINWKSCLYRLIKHISKVQKQQPTCNSTPVAGVIKLNEAQIKTCIIATQY